MDEIPTFFAPFIFFVVVTLSGFLSLSFPNDGWPPPSYEQHALNAPSIEQHTPYLYTAKHSRKTPYGIRSTFTRFC